MPNVAMTEKFVRPINISSGKQVPNAMIECFQRMISACHGPLQSQRKLRCDGMETVSSPCMPALQLAEGQPVPIAVNGGLLYMSSDRDGDAGAAAATEVALSQVAEGERQAVTDMLDNAPLVPEKHL